MFLEHLMVTHTLYYCGGAIVNHLLRSCYSSICYRSTISKSLPTTSAFIKLQNLLFLCSIFCNSELWPTELGTKNPIKALRCVSRDLAEVLNNWWSSGWASKTQPCFFNDSLFTSVSHLTFFSLLHNSWKNYQLAAQFSFLLPIIMGKWLMW